jgi:predicted nucleic acid-binding protein
VTIVSDSTPIISLATVEKVYLLHELFGHIYIPQTVYKEIKSRNKAGYEEIDCEYFKVTEIKGRKYIGFLLNDLDTGEAEAIMLAKEIDADALIIDERTGFAIARSQNINAIGTLTVLLMAKQNGFIVKVKPVLDEMIANGRWYSRNVYYEFLKQINEF